jgi:hypothetical protein
MTTTTYLYCAAAAVFGVVLLGLGTAASADSVPEAALPPPPGASTVRQVEGGGAQVYACRSTPEGTFKWTLVGPKAVLTNEDGSDFGTHSAGPTWTALDGSSIVADGVHPLIKIDRPGSVPALLVSVTTSSGSGVLTGVRYVRRSDTAGGLPPATGCDAAHADATVARHYSAVYTFYR